MHQPVVVPGPRDRHVLEIRSRGARPLVTPDSRLFGGWGVRF